MISMNEMTRAQQTVAAGRVYGRRVAGSAAFDSYVLRDDGRGPSQKVTSRMTELDQAGWVRVGEPESASFFARKTWELTRTGEAVLAEEVDPRAWS